jgi:predicted transcriptional regulator
MADESSATILTLAAQIVSAHIGHNMVPADRLPDLIRQVHSTLARAGNEAVVQSTPEPAVTVQQSLKRNRLICIDCGKPFTAIKEHLNRAHNMSPDQYRLKWKLPLDYPMVTPNYAKIRSTLAKKVGLGSGARSRDDKGLND